MLGQNTVEKILIYFKRAFKAVLLLPEFTAAKLTQKLRRLPANRKTILFVLNDYKLYTGGDGNGRYIYLILNRFSEAGYNVYFYKNINFRSYVRFEKLLRLIYRIKNLKVVDKLPDDTSRIIYAFDTVDPSMLRRDWRQQIYVNTFNSPSCRIGEVIWIPYFMFPGIYQAGQHKLLNSYRGRQRKLRMMFAGNTRVHYNDPGIKQLYGHLTRVEGLNALLELNGSVTCGADESYFCDTLHKAEYTNECRILLTTEKFPIKPTDWLKLISMADFFVCLSGTNLPMCHHDIEAIAVGTIPIIAHPDWFFPPLEHKKNAIVYSGKADLIQKVQEVFRMPAEEINRLRKNVIEYYDRYLTTDSFIQNCEAQQDDIYTIMLHPRLVPNKPEEEQKKALTNLQSHPYFSSQSRIGSKISGVGDLVLDENDQWRFNARRVIGALSVLLKWLQG